MGAGQAAKMASGKGGPRAPGTRQQVLWSGSFKRSGSVGGRRGGAQPEPHPDFQLGSSTFGAGHRERFTIDAIGQQQMTRAGFEWGGT